VVEILHDLIGHVIEAVVILAGDVGSGHKFDSASLTFLGGEVVTVNGREEYKHASLLLYDMDGSTRRDGVHVVSDRLSQIYATVATYGFIIRVMSQ
jgi:hypothetical protein